MRIGGVEVELATDGTMRFDGGAFFGVVPRVLWERLMPPDERNRVTVRLNCPLVRAGGRTVLVDTGVGTKHPPRRRAIFAMEAGRLVDDLRARGVEPEDVDYVVLSHLHFDHVGGATHRSATDELRVTFPRAQHLVQRADWEEATHPNERNAAGYFAEDFDPLRRAGQIELLDGDTEVVPGVWCRRTGGHTAGHQVVTIEVGGRTAAFFGDLVPTAHHLPLPYSQSYDLYPLELLERKRELLERALREEWLVILDHEVEHPVGYLETPEGGRPRLRPARL